VQSLLFQNVLSCYDDGCKGTDWCSVLGLLSCAFWLYSIVPNLMLSSG
jgi:hypothetical protein